MSINNEIKRYNKLVSDLNKYKNQKKQAEYEYKFTRKFSPNEKQTLSSVTKELKMFVVNYSFSEPIPF
ncbi:hypothetical protein J2S17_003830 [Cytobacillus purgationiresistens]|uniref:Uncharacterized protein n=1 Tax=Cytobacillus purgationiresistens TaxID=863449 RepID=A0ABU0AMB4_9BACI|nr:hypothetical protein [Cytobacillus purgationiresistens]